MPWKRLPVLHQVHAAVRQVLRHARDPLWAEQKKSEESEEAADRDLPGIDGIDDGCSVVNGIYCLVGIPTSHQPNEEKASEDCCTEKNSS